MAIKGKFVLPVLGVGALAATAACLAPGAKTSKLNKVNEPTEDNALEVDTQEAAAAPKVETEEAAKAEAAGVPEKPAVSTETRAGGTRNSIGVEGASEEDRAKARLYAQYASDPKKRIQDVCDALSKFFNYKRTYVWNNDKCIATNKSNTIRITRTPRR